MESALAEALFLCNVERNGDIVEMTSYAPLLAKEGHHNWNPDLIYFDNEKVMLTPSYKTQQLFSVFSGDRYVKSTLTIDEQLKHRVAASVVKDSKTGKTCLKLVNALPVEVTVDVKGMDVSSPKSTQGFQGKPTDNHFEEDVTWQSNGSTITLPPYSVRAVEL
jgi:alpha-L-arabinofuranosidase